MQSPVLAAIELSLRPFVRPSHAGTMSKRHKLGSQNLHHRLPKDSSRGEKSSSRNSKGFTTNEELNESGVGKICNFQPISHLNQKQCKIGPRLLLTTNRKSYTPFRLVPKSATLDDLEWPIRTLLHKTCVFWSPSQKFE